MDKFLRKRLNECINNHLPTVRKYFLNLPISTDLKHLSKDMLALKSTSKDMLTEIYFQLEEKKTKKQKNEIKK